MTSSDRTSAEHRAAAPVFVLGSHRSGTSAVMGLLATAGGLEVGDVMPATEANAKGYFESTAIVLAHNQLLASLDCDWTCPPASFDPASASTVGIAAEISRLDASGKAWGIKDPRMLYMLPAWLDLVPEMRFVGVFRDHEEVVRSLQARDGLDPAVADTITRAYVRRLAVLRNRFDFPVIEVSSSPDEVLRQTAVAAASLGLPWNQVAAERFFDPTMIGNRSHGWSGNPDIDRLRTLAGQPTPAEPISSEAVREVLEEFAKDPDDFDRYSGPRSTSRRAIAWTAVPRDVANAVELTRNLKVASSLDPVKYRGQAIECADVMTLYDALRAVTPRADAVVLADATSWLRRDTLGQALTLVHEHLAVDGMVVIALSEADRQTQLAMGREPLTESDVRAAALAAGFLELPGLVSEDLRVLRFGAVASTSTLLRALLERAQPQAEMGTRTRSSVDSSDTVSQPEELHWKHQYERLRNRRSVQFSLALADKARPLFRVVRQARQRWRTRG